MASSNAEVVEKSQIVWLTVKPHAISKVLTEISPVIRPDYHLVVSAAAGIPLKTLEKVSQDLISAHAQQQPTVLLCLEGVCCAPPCFVLSERCLENASHFHKTNISGNSPIVP